MTDFKTISKMLEKAGIEPREESLHYDENRVLESMSIEVKRGYIGFVTAFTFDKSGNLIDVASYEQ